jgi:hypothetical protein
VASFGVSKAERPSDIADELIQKGKKGYEEREPYRDALKALVPGEYLRIAPDENVEGETTRAIKFRLIAAAKETNVNIKYGDGKNGDVVAWLDTGAPGEPSGTRRSTRKKNADAPADVSNTESSVTSDPLLASGANGTADATSDEQTSELASAGRRR